MTEEYKVLSLKYRPTNFSELVGHESMVRTISNAILNHKLAHSFILTGIRGIGKTTTARIIAKIINCEHQQINHDANGQEIVEACGECDNCKAIAESRHPDILELDAASRTGVDDIREIIDTVAYSPVIAPYKVYIIDEVHMLSKNAFNALLKTLEEPPSHVKFIFATTEIQKVPITILSRCQRFDLKRLNHQQMTEHLRHILAKEQMQADDEILSMIATASEGSVRDALSLLDQAISLGNYAQELNLEAVSSMLGVVDKLKIYRLLQEILSGNTAAALAEIAEFYRVSIDIHRFLDNLLTAIHHVTLAKTSNEYFENMAIIDSERTEIQQLATQISIASIIRVWQAVLNGVKEVLYSINQREALEMLIIKVCYLSTLPTPNEVIRKLTAETLEADAALNSETAADKAKLEAELLQKFAGAQILDSEEN